MARFPIGELLVSEQFLNNRSPAAKRLIELAHTREIPVRVASDGDHSINGRSSVQLFQAAADQLQHAQSDNEKSLVVRIQYAGRTILLPGDLEGPALNEVLPRLGQAEVLVSPHHGSRKANIPIVMESLQPKHVVVSARNHDAGPQLRQIYQSAKLHFTSQCGAVQVTVDPDGNLRINRHRASHPPSAP